jgi:hypothetical protein
VLENLTARQIGEAMAEYQLSPWAEERFDLSNAYVAAAVRTAAGEDNVRLGDWMPTFDEKREQSPEEMRAILRRRIEASEKG